MNPLPCKQCPTFAVCFHKVIVECTIVCKWIREQCFIRDSPPFNKKKYDLAMDEIEKQFGRRYSTNTSKGKIWDRLAYEKEMEKHLELRRKWKENGNTL